jgi:tetratricopeptide (TPR) repeat protein
MATRPVLRIFISSTAVDLREYRDKVRDAVLRLQDLPIAMETFSAQSGAPASECMRMATEADAVVCIVAHRYGYVPPVDLGADGERSITWLEVDAAKQARKPVFAFVVDPKAPWTEPKEQDRLTSEPDKAEEIVKAVKKLQEFKAWLGARCIWKTFTNPDDLSKHVAITLANFTPAHGSVSTARVWQPLFCHALQPAQHFKGRVAKLRELKDWLESAVTPDRVISVVAAGGTGKTALVHEALHQATLSTRAGVFVWSFYEDPHTDAFLREAYVYFTGEKDAPAGGMLERLQLALSGDAPHVLILDGLERVQCDEGRRRRGELEDLQLKRLVRALAGGIGNARALVTSRFPLVDLDDWTGAGHRAIPLDDLELPVALEVLRAWGVKGGDATLTQMIDPLNMDGLYHALSIAALGSYIGNFAGGDPSRAPEFSPEDAKDSDPKARRLYRILEQYAKALTAVERDLLARLSLFPRGVKVELLGWIVQSGGEVAGVLVGLSDHQLVKHLERLKALGLVFRYETDRQAIYSAHPFLREFFRDLLGTKPESVHESVRARLAPSLEARPKTKPSDPTILDQYELLIEQTLLAGRVQQAFDLYWGGLASYKNLGKVLGENTRGLRMVERFVPRDDFSLIEPHLPPRECASLVNDLGLFAENLGDIARAREAFRHARDLIRSAGSPAHESIYAQNLADADLNAGHFGHALVDSESAVSLAGEAKDDAETVGSLCYRATAHFALGNFTAAAADFQRGTELEGEPLCSLVGTWEAGCKLLRTDPGSTQPNTSQPGVGGPRQLGRRSLPLQRSPGPAPPSRRSHPSRPASSGRPRLRQPFWIRRAPAPLLPRRLRTAPPSRRSRPIHYRSRSRYPARRHLRLRMVLHRSPPRSRRNAPRCGRPPLSPPERPQCARPLGSARLPIRVGESRRPPFLRPRPLPSRRARTRPPAPHRRPGTPRASRPRPHRRNPPRPRSVPLTTARPNRTTIPPVNPPTPCYSRP